MQDSQQISADFNRFWTKTVRSVRNWICIGIDGNMIQWKARCPREVFSAADSRLDDAQRIAARKELPMEVSTNEIEPVLNCYDSVLGCYNNRSRILRDSLHR